MQWPVKLKKGDKVCFIAPARKVRSEELVTAQAILEEWGLQVVATPQLFLENHQFAGTDQDRAAQVQWALDHDELRALFCVRGGYGTSRIIDQLSFDKLKKHPKWLIGFSDITVLLSRFFNEGICTIHGPVALLFDQKGNTLAMKRLRALLFGRNVDGLQASPCSLNRCGIASGPLVGGNLSVLVDQIGTTAFPDLTGGILFLEDLDEYLYHIDRLMTHLVRIGVFHEVKGLVIGYMSGMHDNKVPFGASAEEIVANAVRDFDFPVGFRFPIGHEALNMPVVIGEHVKLSVSKESVELVKK